MAMNNIIGVNSPGVNSTLLINAIWCHFGTHMKIFGLNCGFCNLVFSLWLQFWSLAFYTGDVITVSSGTLYKE